MARLTRTQKYADLRDNLANDSEQSLLTKELTDYQNRLDNLVNQSNHELTSTAPVNEAVNPFPLEEKTPIEQLVDSFKEEENRKEASQVVVDEESLNVQPVVEQPIVKEPVFINPAITEPIVQQPVVEDTSAYNRIEISPIGPVSEPVVKEEEIAEFEDEKPEFLGLYVNPEIEKAYLENSRNVEQFQNAQQENFYSQMPEPTYQQEPVYEAPVSQPVYEAPVSQQVYQETPEVKFAEITEPEVEQSVVVEEPVVEQPSILSQPADNHAIIQEEQTANTFISNVMDEVNEHIALSGHKTITDLTNNMVNEIRGVEEPVITETWKQETEINPKPVVKPYSDEEFSNTVSLEISKIMDEVISLDKQNVEPVITPVEQPVVAPVIEPVVAPVIEPVIEPVIIPEIKPVVEPAVTPVVEQPVVQPVITPVVEETPVIQEEVVEIKNINETDMNAPVKEATTGTIPFIVTPNDEDFIEEDEQEGSNTILNIILIILIIILLCVLGLIVFYILKTKGII